MQTTITTKNMPFNARRAYHIARGAIQETREAEARGDTHFTYYFNQAGAKAAHARRSTFNTLLRDQAAHDTDVHKETIQGIVGAWHDTLPHQLVTIIGQLSNIVGQKWYGGHLEAHLLGVVEEIAYCAYTHNDGQAIDRLNSVLSPYQPLKRGIDLLDFVAQKAYRAAAEDMRKNTMRPLKYFPELKRDVA